MGGYLSDIKKNLRLDGPEGRQGRCLRTLRERGFKVKNHSRQNLVSKNRVSVTVWGPDIQLFISNVPNSSSSGVSFRLSATAVSRTTLYSSKVIMLIPSVHSRNGIQSVRKAS